MSARDDYPKLAWLAQSCGHGSREAPRALDEIDRLRAELARVYTAIGERAIQDLLAAPQPVTTPDDLNRSDR